MNPNGSFMSWKEALHRDFPCGHRMEKKRRRFYAVDCTLFAYARHAALAPPVGGSFPRPLSAQEEKKYVERMLAGDIEARNVLVEHNLRLVAHIAKKYYTQSDEQDDLISIALSALSKAFRATVRKRVQGLRPTLPNAWRILS